MRHILAAGIVSESGPQKVSETYRVSIDPKKDPMAYNAIVSLITKLPSKGEQRANMIMMHKHAETLSWLRKLSPEQLERAAPDLAKTFKIVVDLNQLQNVRNCSEELYKLRNKQLEQCRWLISHQARNNMIQSICYLLTESEIRQIRGEMNIPAQIGRASALTLEEQLSVQQAWHELCNTDADEFSKYRRLQETFPQFDLGRLNAAIHGI